MPTSAFTLRGEDVRAHRIVIIEGTDGTGKTTLASKLVTRLPETEYRHASAPTRPTWMHEYVDPLRGPDRIVADRWHLGEWVWPAVFGRPSLFKTLAEVQQCHNMIRNQDALVLVLDRAPTEIVQTLEDRGETPAQVRQALAGREQFLELATTLNVPIINTHETGWLLP